ncbi:MAG: 2-oxo-4-hydroxy-4-carboxy-5-ureidoimidazoline decarboxylase [Verrucomicrobia bacterium]|nr:2-oxo-4-hydroxy-4-carboxy-5-ureidoimidazoline decarboxylase [Verrucomicrobiota bacterium]
MSQTKHRLENVNQMDESTFVSVFGSVYEHSSWIAEAAWQRRPFASLDNLHAAMDSIVQESGRSRQTTLIKSHPELAGRLAQSAQLTAESRSEQAQAGLSALPENLTKQMLELNSSYQKKFGFPFIICARLNNVATILQAMEARLTNDSETEFKTSLQEISKIARLRLADIIV